MTSQTETEKLLNFMEGVVTDFGRFGRNVQAMTDALFPEMRELREAAARLGYQGSRCGWYPEKPKRRRKARR
jgi:hypothetical protein